MGRVDRPHSFRDELSDRLKAALASAAHRLSTEFTVHHEVERRLAMMEAAATSTTAATIGSSDLELVREVHADLRAAVGQISDLRIRERVVDACRRLADVGAGRAPGPVLAPREIDVIAQVALGCTNAESAQRLSVTPETIKSYLRSAMRKLDARTRHEAVVRARTHGLLP